MEINPLDGTDEGFKGVLEEISKGVNDEGNKDERCRSCREHKQNLPGEGQHAGDCR